jgi:hypothetical protein
MSEMNFRRKLPGNFFRLFAVERYELRRRKWVPVNSWPGLESGGCFGLVNNFIVFNDVPGGRFRISYETKTYGVRNENQLIRLKEWVL